MADPIKPWTNRLVEVAFMVLLAALMLSWAWALLEPLVPVVAVTTVAVGLLVSAARLLLARERRW